MGADVPFFLTDGPQLGAGDGTSLTPVSLPRSYSVVLVLPASETKQSTKSVYDAFDDRRGEIGFDERAAALRAALNRVSSAADLAELPKNDLARSPIAGELEQLGSFRADVSGAGPVVYGLFESRPRALQAGQALSSVGRVWVTAPAWYG